jgi:hypothetical protein
VIKRMSAATFAAAVAMVCVASGLEAQESGNDVTSTKDLTAVIALQGLPCGQVVSATKKGEDDYVVSCQDGNRYHVVVNADGRVVVQKI